MMYSILFVEPSPPGTLLDKILVISFKRFNLWLNSLYTSQRSHLNQRIKACVQASITIDISRLHNKIDQIFFVKSWE